MTERTELEKVAKQYKEEGYEIVLQPTGADLPAFLKGFKPDMIARKESESVIVEVKTRANLSTDHQLSYLASIVNAQPGWRFDLVVTKQDIWPDEISRESRELTKPEIESLVQTTNRLAEMGELKAASLIAWSAVEAVLREVSRSQNIQLERKYPQFIIKTLYSDGLLSRSDYERLQEVMHIRNAVAHGLKTTKLTVEVITYLIGLVNQMLRKV